jgi:ribonuclease Z
MRPSFHPRLVNDPFDDPGLFIPFLYESRAILFDAGEIHALSARDILKISHVFVTHTHMDHFVGFDRLLRLCLGREKRLHLFGPEGFIRNVEGKLSGYSWNLVSHYQTRFILTATEVRNDSLISRQYPCREAFTPQSEKKRAFRDGMLVKEPAFSVSAILLDHRIPCLGLSITEQFHVNIKKDAVLALGLEIGPWLKEFKGALFKKKDPESVFDVKYHEKGLPVNRFRLGDLSEKIAVVTPGQKVSYIADIRYDESELDRICRFIYGSDHLYIEAAFSRKDEKIAEEKSHLTAWQAGTIAGRSHARQFTLFHFSPRYTDKAHLLQKEADEAYREALGGTG